MKKQVVQLSTYKPNGLVEHEEKTYMGFGLAEAFRQNRACKKIHEKQLNELYVPIPFS